MNVGKVCPGCMEKRKAETQKNIAQKIHALLDNKRGFNVKRAFTDENGIEHMWVGVLCVDFNKREVYGLLNNDPVTVKNIKLGDKAVVRFCDIEEIWEEDGHAREARNTLPQLQ